MGLKNLMKSVMIRYTQIKLNATIANLVAPMLVLVAVMEFV